MRASILPSLFRVVALVAVAASISGIALPGARQDIVRLSGIGVRGLKRYSTEQVIAVCGLQPGRLTDIKDFAAAAGRLAGSGLFKTVSYRFIIEKNEAVLTFSVEEAIWDVPVVFDNFIWFTDEELIREVAKEVPSFDGTAPQSGGVTNSIAEVLSRLMRERAISGTVEHLSAAELSGKNPEHVFAVRGLNLRVCKLTFDGAAPGNHSELVQLAKPVLADSYSKAALSSFVKSGVLWYYRKLGQWRAAADPLLAKPGSGTQCDNGVEVTVPVREGAVYLFANAEWSGNAAIRTEELGSLFKLKTGEVADGSKIEAGFSAVKKAYGKIGHIRVTVTPEQQLDDSNLNVSYRISLSEGPQFRMGSITFQGLSTNDDEMVRKRWKLRRGEVYDSTYIEEFMTKGLAGTRLSLHRIELVPDPENRTVDLSITLRRQEAR
jgi:outer membrane protein assembly factor BamA